MLQKRPPLLPPPAWPAAPPAFQPPWPAAVPGSQPASLGSAGSGDARANASGRGTACLPGETNREVRLPPVTIPFQRFHGGSPVKNCINCSFLPTRNMAAHVPRLPASALPTHLPPARPHPGAGPEPPPPKAQIRSNAGDIEKRRAFHTALYRAIPKALLQTRRFFL